MSFADVIAQEKLTFDPLQIGDMYDDYRLVRITGWPLEYIHNLGLLQSEAFLQFYGAEQALLKPKVK